MTGPPFCTAQLFRRWRASPPDAFSVRWSGTLFVDHPGIYTFTTMSDGVSRLSIDEQLVADNPGQRFEKLIVVGRRHRLDSGLHSVVLEYAHDGGPYTFEWWWARDGGASKPVPRRALSHGSRGRVAIFARWFDTLWWVVSGACLLLGAASAMQRVMLLKAFREWWRRPVWLTLRVTVLVAVLVSAGWLYLAGAGEHSRVMNISSATGDQNAYLLDAMQVYANRAGQDPSMLIGQRMRMPIYAAYLSLFYTPRLSGLEFLRGQQDLEHQALAAAAGTAESRVRVASAVARLGQPQPARGLRLLCVQGRLHPAGVAVLLPLLWHVLDLLPSAPRSRCGDGRRPGSPWPGRWAASHT